MSAQLSLDSWASLAGVPGPASPRSNAKRSSACDGPSSPSLARAHANARARRAQRAAQASLPLSGDDASSPGGQLQDLDEVCWTLSDWADDGASFLRFWLPDRPGSPQLVAACVEPDDASDAWTITVLRPTGRDRVAWWSGGNFARQVRIDPSTPPTEGERRERRDGEVFRIELVPSPHAATLAEGQHRADASLTKMLRRCGRGA